MRAVTFFEYPNIREIAKHLAQDHRDAMTSAAPYLIQTLGAERDVLQHRHVIGQSEMLMDHADAGLQRHQVQSHPSRSDFLPEVVKA